MGEYPMGKHPNSQAVRRGFKSGKDWNGRAGGAKAGATERQWWNALLTEYDDASGKYSVAELEAFVAWPKDDKTVSLAKRIVAQNILDQLKGGRNGLAAMALFFDRMEGKAPQSLSLIGGPEVKRIVLLDERASMVQDTLPAPDDE